MHNFDNHTTTLNASPLSARKSEVESAVQVRCERLLEELVNIDSPTTKIAGVRKAQDAIARELRHLGFTVSLVANNSPIAESAELLIAELPGETAAFVTLVSHCDTVQSTATCGLYRRDEKHGYGSGVIDNKGGLVVMLEGLRVYLSNLRAQEGGNQRDGLRPRYSIRVVCSPNEEAGSLGFHDVFRGLSEDSKMVLGFEPALDCGSIIESRRGNRWYQIEVTGEEAHAGRCRGEQINAAHELAIKIAKLHELNDQEGGLSVNVGQFEGGRDRFNVVCGSARAKLDTRFRCFEGRDRLHRSIESILFTSFVSSPVTGRSSQASYAIVDDCPPFSNTRASEKAIDFLVETINSLEGRTKSEDKVTAKIAGGAGDVNYMSRENLVVIDGLGPVGGKMHHPGEYISLQSLGTRARVLAALLDQAPELLE